MLLGALWAELYGVAHLGASAMVFSTGLAPAIMGPLIDRGAAMEAIAAGSALYCLAASAVAATARQAERQRTTAQER